MPSFTHTLAVNTSAARLWALVGDVARLAGVFPYITVEEITAPAPDCWRFWRSLDIPNVATLRWHEEATISAPGTLAFQAIAGDVETFTGAWTVTEDGDASVLSLMVEYDVPARLTATVPAFMAPLLMNELFKAICARVKEVAEEAA